MLERFFHNRSIKGKLTSVMMTVTGIVLLFVTLAFVVNETVTFRMAIHRELRTLAGIVGLNTTAAITFGDRKSADTTLTTLAVRPHIKAAYILSPEGEVIAGYLPKGIHETRVHFLDGSGQQQLQDNRAALAKLESGSHPWWEWNTDLEVVERIMLENQVIGVVVIQSDLMELFVRLKWFFVLVSLITIIALGFAYLLSGMMHQPISRPILDLAEAMKSVAEEKNYGLRVQKRGDDEIGQLIDGFNEMLGLIQKRDESLGRFAAELKESNEELKAFIYSAAHDLRQPLVNIRGFTAELKRSVRELHGIVNAQGGDPDGEHGQQSESVARDVDEAAGFIDSSVERMSVLINALIKLSQAGHRDLDPEPIEMTALVRNLLSSYAQQISGKNATVVMGTLPDVVADRLAMEQIIGNLLDNAVKFLVPGRPGTVEVSGELNGDGVVYRIRDNGRGISSNDMSKLFHLFRRLGKQDVAGDGVGLAYVRALVKRHGGRIWCESEPGTGSTFIFTIPPGKRDMQMHSHKPHASGVLR
jgi:signal transduction histidine kinase